MSGALKIDSGAQLNTMPVKEYRRLYPDRFSSDGEPLMAYVTRDDKTKLVGYGNNRIEHYGKITLPCEYNNIKFMCSFNLVEVDGPPLMGLPTGEALGIIKINTVDIVASTEAKDEENSPEEEPAVGAGIVYVNPNTRISRPTITLKADLRVMYPECFEENKALWGPKCVSARYTTIYGSNIVVMSNS